MHVDNAKKNLRYSKLTRILQKLVYIHQINAKFSKTMCALLYFTRICCNTNFSIKISEGKRTAFPVISSYLGETDQYEDQSKDILNSILEEELSDSDSEALIEELRAGEVLLLT